MGTELVSSWGRSSIAGNATVVSVRNLLLYEIYPSGYTPSMNPIRELRDALGLTQQQLATVANTSQSAVAAYEGGRKSPTWRTVERLAQAAGCHVELRYLPPLTREDRRSLAVHAAIADRLREAPLAVLAHARASLARMRVLHPGARPLLDEWRLLLRRPLDALIPVLRDPSPWSRELRQVTPFTGILSARERAQVYREFARAEQAAQADPSLAFEQAS
jgi:transcriptional regulator with XRE-family HTH domain